MHEKWTSRQLEKLAGLIASRRGWFIYPQVLVAISCFIYAFANLGLSASRADLISEDVPHQQHYVQYKREFQVTDALVAVVESESPDKNRRFMEMLAARVRAEPNLFRRTYFKGDLERMGLKGLLFLPEETLAELHQTMEDAWPILKEIARTDSLDALFRLVNRRIRESSDGALNPEDVASAVPMLRVLRRLVDEAHRSMIEPTNGAFPGLVALFGDQSRLYLTFGGGEIYALVTHAARPEVEGEAVERLRDLVQEIGNEVRGVNSGISGEPVLNHDEMKQARLDIAFASIVSAGLVALIFIVGFHEVRRPVLATVCLAIGIGYSLAFAAATVGRLNILSVTLVPILIGLSIDFGVHLISRYEEELRSGNSAAAAMCKALAFTGTGVFTSGFTTAAAFFAMMMTDFKGLQEMGLISGAGLLLCLTPMMTMLPALLVGDSRVGTRARRSGLPIRQIMERAWLKRPGWVAAGAAVLTVVSASQVPHLRFDYNLLNLQTEGLPSVGIEEKLIRTGADSLLHGLVIADSLGEATELERRLESLEQVSHVTSMVDYLTEDQSLELELVRKIKARAADLNVAGRSSTPPDLLDLNSTLFALQGYLGLALEQLQTGAGIGNEPRSEIEALRNSVIDFRARLDQAGPQAADRLDEFQDAVFDNLRQTVELIRHQDSSGSLTIEDLPPFLREQFISPGGKFLLQVHSPLDLWNREHQKAFISEVRTVAPNVTGTVVQIFEFTSLLKHNFLSASVYSGAIIAIVLLIHFQRIRPVLLTSLPVIVGLIWMVGVMVVMGLQFNPVNSMAPTLLIGIAVANGVHILNRFAEEPTPAILSRSTGKAVIVSALTTVAGFGALIIARHQGIASLGAVMAIGTGACLVAALGLLPALLTLWNPLKPPAGDPRGTD